MKKISYEEFYKTVYHTEKSVVLPLISVRLDKTEFFKKGKLDLDALNSTIRIYYDEKIK